MIAHKKIYSLTNFIIVFTSCILFINCNNKHRPRNIERSFYYWKSVLNLNDFEKEQVTSLKVKTIFLRFFDVDWDEVSNSALPKAPVKIIDTAYFNTQQIKIIPVVFITNECLQKVDSTQITSLANKIISLLKSSYNISFSQQKLNEIQIDCDWSATTKQKYFSLLSVIKKSGITTLSVTIRLHQIKYLKITGIPPADRGLLMCYNMGNLINASTKNSIIEVEELKKYINDLAAYPLPLDIGLPLFDWYVLFRNDKFKGLIKTLNTNNLSTKKIDTNHFFILKDTVINKINFKKGDILRQEESKYETILNTGKLLNEKLSTGSIRISYFHLDSVTLKKYPTNELENIYNSMR